MTSDQAARDQELSDKKHAPAWVTVLMGLVAVPVGLFLASLDDWEPDRVYLVPVLGLISIGWGVRQRVRAGSWTRRTYMTEEEVDEAESRRSRMHRWNLGRLGVLGVVALAIGVWLLISGTSDSSTALVLGGVGVAALLGGATLAWVLRRKGQI